MSNFVVKIQHGDEIRRKVLPRIPLFSELSFIVAQFFPSLGSAYSLKYKDEDGDRISVSSDEEVKDAFTMASAVRQPLRFFIVEKSVPASQPVVSFSEPPATVIDSESRCPFKRGERCGGRRWGADVHWGITCDGCSAFPIKGLRFKCQQCADFDFCSTCMTNNKGHDSTHTFEKFETAVFRGPFPGGRRFWGPHQAEETSTEDGAPATGHCGMWRKMQQNRGCARFLADVTVPDGALFAPGAKFTKVWKLKNHGSQAWPEATSLAFVGGDALGAPTSVVVGPIASGNEVDVAVEMVAPPVPGRFVSYWRLTGADGVRFGHRVWADIAVTGPQVANVLIPSTLPPVLIPNPAKWPEMPVIPATPAPTPCVVEPKKVEEIKKVEVSPVPCPLPAVVFPATLPLTPEEAKNLSTLRDMGFKGDLLAVLRRNNNSLGSALRELLGTADALL